MTSEELKAAMTDEVIELADMTAEQQAIVAAGDSCAGTFPAGLSKDELAVWIEENLLTTTMIKPR